MGSGQKLELIQVFMAVSCKNEEDPIRNEGASVVTASYIDFEDTEGQLNL